MEVNWYDLFMQLAEGVLVVLLPILAWGIKTLMNSLAKFL